jgi:hypothetical protein
MSTGPVRQTTGDGSRQSGRGRQYRDEVWDCWTFDICAGFNGWMCRADSANKFVRLTFGRPQGVPFSTAFSQAEHPLWPRQRVSDRSNWQDAYGIQSPVHSHGRPALKDAATAEPLALELVCRQATQGSRTSGYCSHPPWIRIRRQRTPVAMTVLLEEFSG